MVSDGDDVNVDHAVNKIWCILIAMYLFMRC